MTGVDHPKELDKLESLFANPAACCRSIETITNMVVDLSVQGYAKAVLELATQCSEPVVLKPLIDGVRLHLGMVINSTGAARALAIHFAETIRDGGVILNGV